MAKSTWERSLKFHYGITIEDWHAMLIAQSGRCDICTKPMMKPLVDHCHETGRVRALLCGACNVGLGQFQDDVALMLRAIAYLEQHR